MSVCRWGGEFEGKHLRSQNVNATQEGAPEPQEVTPFTPLPQDSKSGRKETGSGVHRMVSSPRGKCADRQRAQRRVPRITERETAED